MRDRCYRAHVGHLEGLRTRRLDQYGARVRLEQLFDAGADQRIEIAGLDAIARQDAVAEIAGRPIGVVADQDVVAGFAHREQGGRDRGQSRRCKTDARALRSFQRHQQILQRARRRRAAAAILELAAMGVQVVGGRIKHGGTADHRRIDKALLCFCVAARRHQSGLGFLRVRCTVAVSGIHGFAVVFSGLSARRARRSNRQDGY